MNEKAEFEDWYKTRNPWRFDNSPADKCRTGILLDYVRHGSYENHLDIGCGEGVLTEQLSQFAERTTAFDISQTAIDRAIENSGNSNRVHYFQLDVKDLDKIRDRDFDLITCSEILYYLTDEDRRKAIGDICELLADNGVFIVTLVVIGENEYRKYFDYNGAISLLSEKFRIIKVFPSVLGNEIGFLKKIIVKMCKCLKKHEAIKRIVMASDLSECYQAGFVCIKKCNDAKFK